MQAFKQILENWIVLIPSRWKKYLPNHNMNHKNILTNCLIKYKEHYIECFILHSILWQLVIRRGKLYLLNKYIHLWDYLDVSKHLQLLQISFIIVDIHSKICSLCLYIETVPLWNPLISPHTLFWLGLHSSGYHFRTMHMVSFYCIFAI